MNAKLEEDFILLLVRNVAVRRRKGFRSVCHFDTGLGDLERHRNVHR